MTKTALFSLYDTTHVAEFARALTDLGWRIVATAETVAILTDEGIRCEDISSFTGITEDFGIPPTLHPKIENALTVESASDRIDLVYDIPYPLEVGNDVGGRVLLALAAKGNRVPVMSPSDMEQVINALRREGAVPPDLRERLIDKANAEIAAHYLNLIRQAGGAGYAGTMGQQVYELMNGENPYQAATLYAGPTDDRLALPRFELLSETVPCFTNLADVDCILNTFCMAGEAFLAHYGRQPFITVGAKHGNACGMSVSWNDPAATVQEALFGDPTAIWGGELITNFSIDRKLAEMLVRSSQREELLGQAGWMLDVVVAPAYTEEALETLRRRRFRKLLHNDNLANPRLELDGHSYRWVRGGFIRQWPPGRVLRLEEAEATSDSIESKNIDSLIVAWSVAFGSFHGGNEVALAKEGSLIGVGGGPSTVLAAETAVARTRRANHDPSGGVFAADAFFPFTDAPEVLVQAGVTLGIVPAGGKNEKLVREVFAGKNVDMFYLPEDFRGFYRH